MESILMNRLSRTAGVTCTAVSAIAAVLTLQGAAVALGGSEDLFPTGLGSAWTYNATVGTKSLSMTATITSSKSTGGKTTIVTRWSLNGQPMQDETYIVSASEVSRARSGAYGANVLNPPLPVIKYPMSVGKTWSWSGTISAPNQQGVSANATLKVAGKETVKSSQGTVTAYRVDMDLTVTAQGQTAKIPATYWFAPGAGMVKQSAAIPGPNGQNVTIEATATTYKIK